MAELGLNHTLRLTSNLVMTRLLVPEAFGLIAMVTTLIIGMNLFTDIGIRQSIVRSPRGDEPHFLRVAWTVQILRFAAIAAFIVVSGVLLLQFGALLARPDTVYADPDLPYLVMSSAVVVIFQGFESNNQWLAARNMTYARTTFLNVGSQMIGLAAMIVFASIYPNVWALLSGMLVGAGSKMVLSHLVLAGPKMALIWDREIVDELWRFGRWLIGSSSFTFIAMYADRIILGALLDKETFGFYVIASLWIKSITLLIQKLTAQVGLPILSEVQRDRPKQIKRVFGIFSAALDTICVAGFLAGLVGGPILISVLYPSEYSSAAILMPLISLTILQQRFQAHGNLLLAFGDSKTLMINQAATAILLCIFLLLSYRFFGLTEALVALSLAPLASSPILIGPVSTLLGRTIFWDISIISFIIFCGFFVYLFFGN